MGRQSQRSTQALARCLAEADRAEVEVWDRLQLLTDSLGAMRQNLREGREAHDQVRSRWCVFMRAEVILIIRYLFLYFIVIVARAGSSKRRRALSMLSPITSLLVFPAKRKGTRISGGIIFPFFDGLDAHFSRGVSVSIHVAACGAMRCDATHAHKSTSAAQ